MSETDTERCKAESCSEDTSVEVYWIDPDSGAEFGWTPVCDAHAEEIDQPTRPLREPVTDGGTSDTEQYSAGDFVRYRDECGEIVSTVNEVADDGLLELENGDAIPPSRVINGPPITDGGTGTERSANHEMAPSESSGGDGIHG